MLRPIRTWQLFVFAFILLFAVACVAPVAPGGAMPAPAAEIVPVEPGVLAVTGVFARPSPMAAGNGGVFLTVLNGLDQPLQLTGVAGAIAKAVEMHETVNDQGVMRMEPRPEGFAIPAGATLELKPGGKHIMLFELTKPLVTGDVFTLTLNFDNGSALTIDVPVGEVGGAMPATMPMSATMAMPARADLAPAGPTLADVQGEGIHGWLSSTPAQPTKGTATVDVYLVTDEGQPVQDAKVTFDIDMTNMSHGQYLVPAEPAGAGHYTGSVHFSMRGPWRVIATVERPDQEPVQLRFEFMVAPS